MLPTTLVHSVRFAVYITAASLFVLGANLRGASDPFARVPASLQPLITQGKLSGAVALVATKDKILHLSAVGKSDLATGRAMRTDDFFWIASMTKPIVAVAVAILADEQKLRFSDPVEKYLPEFRQQWMTQEATAERRVLVRPSRPITIFDLLTHTSGMGRGYPASDPHWTLAEMAKVVAREPLLFSPGSRWSYSTPGIDVLGRIVEVVSGMPFAEFMQKRLFGPLGMANTSFWLSAQQEKRLARSYRIDAAKSQLEVVPVGYLYGGAVTDHARPPLGGAGLFSTAEDIVKFYQMLLNRGEYKNRRILKPETVAAMTRLQTGDLVVGRGSGTGLGFSVIHDPTKMAQNTHFNPGTFGHGGAHSTQSWADPVSGLIYVFLIQRSALAENSDIRLAYQNSVAAALATTK